MWLKEKINKYRIEKRKKRKWNQFLNSTNMSLMDNLNNYPRPTKSLLRVLGNGNSLASMLEHEGKADCDYMVMNSHILHPSYFELKPRFYVLADPCFFKAIPNRVDLRYVVDKILTETTWKMTLIVPWEWTHNVEITSTKYVEVLRVNEAVYPTKDEHQQWVYDHNLAMPEVNNVLALALYSAIFLGYNEIELYGVEHSWTRDLYVSHDNGTCLVDTHFYNQDTKDENNLNYFEKAGGGRMKFHEVLQLYASYFPAYWELREIADRKGVHILNCCTNSFIDAFEKR